MTGNNSDDGDNGPIDRDDQALWDSVASSIKPLKGREKRPKVAVPKPEIVKKPAGTVTPQPTVKKPVRHTQSHTGIDGHLQKKLRSGKINPGATLDLHGMTQDQASQLIVDFILEAQAKGQKLVLIVTGTGARTQRSTESGDGFYDNEPGVLKRRFNEFLADSRLTGVIAWSGTAHKKHGGEGAHYVYLRKKRDFTPSR